MTAAEKGGVNTEIRDETLGRTGYEYETLMNLLQVSVSKHLLDDYYTVIWANDYYYKLIGYSKSEYETIYQNKPFLYYMNDELDVHDEELWNQLSGKVMEALSAGEQNYSLIMRMRRKRNENHKDYIWVWLRAHLADEYVNGCQVSYSVMTNITELMEMKLERSVTYDNLPGFVAKYQVRRGLDFKLLEANDRFFDFFGSDSIKSDSNPLFRENVARNQSLFLEQEDTIARGEPVHFTVLMSDQYGNDAWLQINASCVGHMDGDPIYLAIYIDITNETQLRQMQKQLEEQAERLGSALETAEEANRAKSDFLSRMSHDIRTPMNAVLGMKDIAIAHLDEPAKVKDCLNKIGLSGQHLLGLINDVLDMSKIESGEMSLRSDVVSLPEVLENIITIIQPRFEDKDQHFSVRLQCVVHEQFLSDALRLRQILLNILSNACKFTPVGGKIAMDVREVSAEAGIAQFAFTITDTGIGIQPEFLTHLFDAFSRERDSRVDKTEGTGLGMAITKKIVELLGGSIEVVSNLGSGTKFCVTLPLKIEDLPLADGKLPDLNILVVDDNDILCEHTIELLRSIGIYADWVSSGMQAMEKVKAAEKVYDAVLLAWKMSGQDGLETTRQLRSLCGNSLPVLLISAYDWSDIEEDAKKAGVTGFLQKPIFISTLIHGLQRYVVAGQPDVQEQIKSNQIDFVGRRFLLVEDNIFNQEVAQELLADMGATVDIACDGSIGVEMFSHAEKGFYDLILMDIQMPVMNGYEAAKAIRALDRDEAQTIPILALTADAFAEDIRAANDAGMNGHMAKPLDKMTLQREIEKYLV